MAINRGPNIVTDHLVFGMDADDRSTRFYPGEPTTNLIQYMLTSDVSYSRGTNLFETIARESNVVDPSSPYLGYSRFYGTGIAGENAQVFWVLSNSRNKTITISGWLKGSGECRLAIYSDIQGYLETANIQLTPTWTKYQFTASVGNYSSSCWAGVRDILTSTDVFMSGFQIEEKDHPTQFTPTSRNQYQGLIDLTRQHQIDLTNCKFDSTGHPVFDGSTSSYITVPSLGIVSQYTFEIWAYNGANAKMPIASAANNYGIFYAYGSASWAYAHGGVTGEYYHYGSVNFNAFNHMVYTYDGAYVKVYMNGVYIGSQATTGTANFTDGFLIGTHIWDDPNYRWNGKIPIVHIYSKALTQAEVTQNFNAHRSRFGI